MGLQRKQGKAEINSDRHWYDSIKEKTSCFLLPILNDITPTSASSVNYEMVMIDIDNS